MTERKENEIDTNKETEKGRTGELAIENAKSYEELVDFFIENRLEFSDEDPVPTDLVETWEIRDGDRLAAALVLAKRQGYHIIDGIATDPEYRHEKLATGLMEKAVKRTADDGGEAIYLVARAPGFFKTLGFYETDPDEAPDFFECRTCPQYGKDCFPQVMRKDLK